MPRRRSHHGSRRASSRRCLASAATKPNIFAAAFNHLCEYGRSPNKRLILTLASGHSVGWALRPEPAPTSEMEFR